MTYGTLMPRSVRRRPATPNMDRLMAGFDAGLGPRARYAVSRPSGSVLTPEEMRTFDPRVSAEELGDGYRVVAEIPGVEAKDLEINVENGILTIRGERFYEAAPEGEDGIGEAVDADASTENEEVVSRAEQAAPRSAKFERKLRFRGEIVEDAVSASLRNGVLTLTIPKPEIVKPEVRSIPIQTA